MRWRSAISATTRWLFPPQAGADSGGSETLITTAARDIRVDRNLPAQWDPEVDPAGGAAPSQGAPRSMLSRRVLRWLDVLLLASRSPDQASAGHSAVTVPPRHGGDRIASRPLPMKFA